MTIGVMLLGLNHVETARLKVDFLLVTPFICPSSHYIILDMPPVVGSCKGSVFIIVIFIILRS